LLLCPEDIGNLQQAYVSKQRGSASSTSALHGLLLLAKCTYA